MLDSRERSLPLLQLLCVSLVVMWGQGTEATASPQPLKDATFKTLPVSDVMFTEDVLWERPARSGLECSVMCRGDAQCLMFTFRPPTDGPAGSCRSHGKQHIVQGRNESVPGAQIFRLFRDIGIQKPCNNSGDCIEPAACFTGRCLCDGGLFYDHTEKTCVRACIRGFAGTYLEYLGWDLEGHDLYSRSRESLEGCKATCSEDSRCLSFSTQVHQCHYKHATRHHYPRDWEPERGTDVYQKTCA